MKKISLLLFIFTASVCSLHAQSAKGNPYDDAVLLLNDLNKLNKEGKDFTNSEELVSIVSWYFDKQNISLEEALDLLISNDFIKPYITVTKANLPKLTEGASTPTGFSSGLLGMNVTNFADGLARFLIERGKQELSIAFFNRFNENLKTYPELTYLFPQSFHVIQNIESYNIQNLLQELKDAFSKDLLNMPNNILSLRDIQLLDKSTCDGNQRCETKIDAANKRIDKIRSAFISSSSYDSRFLILPLLAIQGILDGNNIIEIADKICADETICSKTDNVSGFIQMSSILLESFRTSDDNGGIFLNQASFKNLFYSKDLLSVFLGLVYQKYNSLSCYENLTIANCHLDSCFKIILKSRSLFYSTLTSFDKINSAYTAILKNRQQNQKPDNSYYATIVSASLKMFSNISTALSRLIPGSLPPGFDRFTINMHIASDICTDIQQRNYAGIFNTTIKFINENNIIKDERANEQLIKYLSFASNLASASNAEEVKEAINAVALPPGSYSIKQRSSVNISLNGYIGYAWDFKGGLYANGIYAPVGFSLSKGLGKKNGGAFTLFTSLIDVGAVASYRLTNGLTDTLKQQIRLESIISPSAQLLFEIPKLPIAVGAGWRLTPKLFYSKNDVFTAVPAKSVFNLSVLIDIPILTISNKPY